MRSSINNALLPLCASRYSSGTANRPRENCADIIDLPLCSVLGGTASPGRNCVNQCDPTKSTDIHNKNCIHFCSVGEAENANCKKIECHQMAATETPDPNSTGGNCKLLSCRRLTLDEIKDPKFFADDNKKYCDADEKCYNFPQSYLPYLTVRPSKPTCKIHNCKPSSTVCGADDRLNIPSIGNYQEDYIRYINVGLPLESELLCTPVNCKTSSKRSYRCTPEDSENPTTLNPNCDSTSSCLGGYCERDIDCNKPPVAIECDSPIKPGEECRPECITTTPETQNNDIVDLYDAWFYRPTIPGPDQTNFANINKNDLCYSDNDMKENGWGTVAWIFGYFHSGTTRSPGHCSARRTEARGLGYGSLCGARGNIFVAPRDDAGYVKGVNTRYNGNIGIYTIRSCLRYQNALRLGACGSRECGIDCAFGTCGVQWCGSDICRDITVISSDNDFATSETEDTLEGLPDPDKLGISGTIDRYVRMTAKRYGRRICTFIQLKGATAYGNQNLTGREFLTDSTCANDERKSPDGTCPNGYNTTCIYGPKNADGICQGRNSNDEPGSAHIWRTVKRISYIGNSLGDNPPRRGYLDVNGRFFAEQECAKIPLRVGPKNFYVVATIENSPNLFEPPLFIKNVMVKKGGIISEPKEGEEYGPTDFYQPEVLVSFGNADKLISLNADETSGDTAELHNSTAVLNRRINVFIKKEYSETNSEPILCLYRMFNDQSGQPLSPSRIQCVKRNKPQMASVKADPDNKFNSAKLILTLPDDPISDRKWAFENPYVNKESCKIIEGYKICSKRDECSELLYDCMDNEAKLYSKPDDTYLKNVKNLCNKTIFPKCNRKLGITQNGSDFASQIKDGFVVDPNYQNFWDVFKDETKAKIDPKFSNAYGWFNEICINKGFEDKLKTVVAYRTIDGVLGKCKIDAAKSQYLQDANPSTNCNAGGKAPYCVCSVAVEGVILPAGMETRTETLREAGLCIDIPLPRFCPAIDYRKNYVINPADPYFVNSSIQNSLGASGVIASGIHQSHLNRSDSPAGIAYGHAEFNSTLQGTKNVQGSCNGFWTYNGNKKPIMICNNDGTWVDFDTASACVRHSCPEISTQINSTTLGIYTNNYADGEVGMNRGIKHGFAIWPKHVKTTELPEVVGSASCIPGFKMLGSTAEQDADGNIISYSTTGIQPARYCDQVGNWTSPGVGFAGGIGAPCERIKCPAITTATEETGGATFVEKWASRSTDPNLAEAESTSFGTCAAPYIQTGSIAPTLRCDHLGNWAKKNGHLDVQNPCSGVVTPPSPTAKCNSINPVDDSTKATSGYASWPETNGGSTATGTCVYEYLIATPFPSFIETRPTRTCINNGDGSFSWGPISSPCVPDFCPEVGPLNANSTNGFATWPKTGSAGASGVEGTCASGYNKNGGNNPIRQCNKNHNIVSWGPVNFPCIK
ncbi:MAG: hypothetical protein K0R25_1114 [Rickettsiaceae bacterium]|nr:hypothetical protein [Rickettsiaceae bacterium]